MIISETMLRASTILLGVLYFNSFLGSCGRGPYALMTPAVTNRAITIGSGGGFAGSYSGYLMEEDGGIYSWSREGNGSEMRTFLFTEPDSVREYFIALDSIRFRSIEFDRPGNLTEVVELRDDDSSHSVRWGEWNIAPPRAVADFRTMTLDFIRRRGGSR